MLLSETFGRFFWIDDDLEFRSCGAFVDGTGDFDNSDYVSEWEDWEGVDYNELFNIHKAEKFEEWFKKERNGRTTIR